MTERVEEWFHDYRRSTKFRNETLQQFAHARIHHFAGAYDKQEQVDNLINLKQDNGVDDIAVILNSFYKIFLQKNKK